MREKRAFVLYEVDAPLKLRFERFKRKFNKDVKLEDFVELDDQIKYDSKYSSIATSELNKGCIRRCFNNNNDNKKEFKK